MRSSWTSTMVVAAVLLGSGAVARAAGAPAGRGGAGGPAVSLETGYRQMYNLEFGQAHQTFWAWQRQHPEDAMGPVSDAAACLFSEFNRLHILEAQFFTSDKAYKSREAVHPDAATKAAFDRDIARARQLAAARLAAAPNDRHALLARVLAAGLSSDYLSLIERQDLEALSAVKQGQQEAENLLRRDPTCYDAYIALGTENYLLGLKPAPVRWILELTGAQADKELGLRQLRLAAEKGQYLAPYARLLLAIAALRSHNRPQAKALLASLARQFPRNPLYRKELAKLD